MTWKMLTNCRVKTLSKNVRSCRHLNCAAVGISSNADHPQSACAMEVRGWQRWLFIIFGGIFSRKVDMRKFRSENLNKLRSIMCNFPSQWHVQSVSSLTLFNGSINMEIYFRIINNASLYAPKLVKISIKYWKNSSRLVCVINLIFMSYWWHW